jgi:hypothetical protein
VMQAGVKALIGFTIILLLASLFMIVDMLT